MTTISLALIAVIIERFIGYPNALLSTIGHPVQWLGKLISLLDQNLNTAPQEALQGKLRGALALIALLTASTLPAWMLSDLLHRFAGGTIVEAVLATAFIAQKSLRDHVLDVVRGLSSSLAEGRSAVAKIVGRQTSNMDESGVAKAALESLAENTADGIVAPVFWFALLGLPGIVAYKAINTADSMIGHKLDRHIHFGFAAAKLDDLVNLPAARLNALLFAAAGLLINVEAAKESLASVWRDAGKHRSPNAGWPESAMAGALGLRFGGPRSYDGEIIDLPYMGNGRDLLTRDDIRRGLSLYDHALWIMLGLLLLLVVIL